MLSIPLLTSMLIIKNPPTSARCASRAILCTVLPKPISSARIPLIPCKKDLHMNISITCKQRTIRTPVINSRSSSPLYKSEASYSFPLLFIPLTFSSISGPNFFLNQSALHNVSVNHVCIEKQGCLQFRD